MIPKIISSIRFLDSIKTSLFSSATTNEGINLITMTFNEVVLESRFQRSLEKRRISGVRLIGIFFLVLHLARFAAYLSVYNISLLGLIIRIADLVLIALLSFAKFPSFLNFSATRRSNSLILVANVMLLLFIVITETSSFSQISAIYMFANYASCLLMLPVCSVVLVIGGNTYLLLNAIPFYSLYHLSLQFHSLIHGNNQGTETFQRFKFLACLVIFLSLLTATSVRLHRTRLTYLACLALQLYHASNVCFHSTSSSG